MSGGENDLPEITIDARRFAGVWANAVRVNGGLDEVTIDSRASTRSSHAGSSWLESLVHRSSYGRC